MADWGQFERETSGADTHRPAGCALCDAMLPDAVDGSLSEAEQRAFDRHLAGCVDCSREFEEAQRGAAWLGMLKRQPPEPSSTLLDRILAQTSGPAALGSFAPEGAAVTLPSGLHSESVELFPMPAFPAHRSPAAASGWGTRVRAQLASAWGSFSAAFSHNGIFQPRLAMTAAMLFFSVALTLNLTGVKLSELRAAALNPSSLRRTLAETSSSAVRSFQNSSVVYQMESRVSDLRSDWAAGAPEPGTPSEPAGSGSQRTGTGGNGGSDTKQSEKPFGSSRLQAVPRSRAFSLAGTAVTKEGV